MTATGLTYDAMTPLPSLERAIAAGAFTGGTLGFATDLVRAAHSRRGASSKQWEWIAKLVERANRPAPVAESLTGDAASIFALFTTAAANRLKWPKIHLTAADDTPVQLSRAGERSRYTGQVMVTDGGAYGSNRYFGRIDTDGSLTPGRDMTPAVRTLLGDFAANPAGIAAAYGRRTGNCCFCRRTLETTESLAVGYGPICADKFGLPWEE